MAIINVGVGDIYVVKVSEDITVDSKDDVLEVEANKIPHTSGGITFNYTATKKDITDDKGVVIDKAKEDEKLTIKIGILEDMASMYEWLTETAEIDDTNEGFTKIGIGGDVQSDSKFVLRYVHTRKNGKKVRYTALVLPADGFSEPYTKGEAKIVDCEVTATALDSKGRLLIKKIEK